MCDKRVHTEAWIKIVALLIRVKKYWGNNSFEAIIALGIGAKSTTHTPTNNTTVKRNPKVKEGITLSKKEATERAKEITFPNTGVLSLKK